MSAGDRRVHATFWLLAAPDSLARQSRREPDGTGLGWFDERGAPRVEKQPLAAFKDPAFVGEALERRSESFVAHVRYASTGAVAAQNTHPFEQAGRLFAHNGVLGGLPALEAQLGTYRALVRGDTDSERFFALVTRHVDEHGGDVAAGLAGAATWAARHLPIYALNVILAAPGELWSLRYPDTHDLYVLERPAGGRSAGRHLDHSSAAGRIRVRSGELAAAPAVVLATERMDEDPGWRNLRSGELLHVDRALRVTSTIAVPFAPVHPLALEDLEGRAAASQAG